ncbi:hypothetical protein [Chenggangzhangella methanolivorans]|uniref:Uncharacterized protein n=1 Tax=Chenggangzhangella methanolivorans TaxID=1437009 RepID=A0A9E6UJ81_9HYPH|nr:hypothetical protein [Chenggangzhangella methanolivorans]QZO01653.1 hypothetical protein K6K41_09785 [Chenggangzhangella methanolivorans]
MSDEAADKPPKQLYGADKTEARLNATTVAAREIIERQRAAQDAKTERLKAARLARDAAEKDEPEG